MEEKNRTLIVFDVDETLIYCDHSIDKENRYEKLILLRKNEAMIALLHLCIQQGIPWRLLTTRTYRCVDQIAEILGIQENDKWRIHTRRHDLDYEIIDKIIADKNVEEMFFERMYKDKCDRLKGWLKRVPKHDVIMLDDRWAAEPYRNLPKGIHVIPPIGWESE